MPELFDQTIENWREYLPFVGFKDYIQHMRTVYDDTPYLCDVRGCERVRGKGYIGRMNLIKHRKREHPQAPKFKDLLTCRLPGCLGIGEKYRGIYEHYNKKHGYNSNFAAGLVNWWS